MRTIDAIGVVINIGTLAQVNIKQSGAVKDRRNIIIADESSLSIQISLWGTNAHNASYVIGQVVALRGARVSDYNGKSLNSGDEHSQMFIDPDHKRVKELKAWWRKQPPEASFISITGGVAATVAQSPLQAPSVNVQA